MSTSSSLVPVDLAGTSKTVANPPNHSQEKPLSVDPSPSSSCKSRDDGLDNRSPTSADTTSPSSSSVARPSPSPRGKELQPSAANKTPPLKISGSKRGRGNMNHKRPPLFFGPLAASKSSVPAVGASNALLSVVSAALLGTSLSGSSSSSTSAGKSSSVSNSNSSIVSHHHHQLPPLSSIRSATSASLLKDPPYVHLSSRDGAASLIYSRDRLEVSAGCLGYRTARANVGVDGGGVGICLGANGAAVAPPLKTQHSPKEEGKVAYYYECIILPPASVKVPPNVRFGDPNMERKLWEARRRNNHGLADTAYYGAVGGFTDGITDGSSTIASRSSRRAREETSSNNGSKSVLPSSTSQDSGLGGSSAPNSGGGTASVSEAHVRLGWSMRTGNLQAPVGYDRWSYGFRDIKGSRCHNSRRDDGWGGVTFTVGDVVGIAVYLRPPSSGSTSSSNPVRGSSNGMSNSFSGPRKRRNASRPNPAISSNSSSANSISVSAHDPADPDASPHIRLFLNGRAITAHDSPFVVSKGVRSGGCSFPNIRPGTYYPAVSCYVGGRVRCNFGPYLVYSPGRGEMPTGMRLKAVSTLHPPPVEPREVAEQAVKEIFPNQALLGSTGGNRGGGRAGRGVDVAEEAAMAQALREAALTEATMRYDAYVAHLERHLDFVREERTKRKIGVDDLPTTIMDEGGEEGKENTVNQRENTESDVGIGKDCE